MEPTLEWGEDMPHPLEAASTDIILNSSLRKTFPPLSHSFPSAWTHAFVLSLGYNSVLSHLFRCSNCSSLGHWELFQTSFCVWSLILLALFVCLSISVLSGTARCSRLISYLPFQKRIGRFSEARDPFLLECGSQKLRPGYSWLLWRHCF